MGLTLACAQNAPIQAITACQTRQWTTNQPLNLEPRQQNPSNNGNSMFDLIVIGLPIDPQQTETSHPPILTLTRLAHQVAFALLAAQGVVANNLIIHIYIYTHT